MAAMNKCSAFIIERIIAEAGDRSVSELLDIRFNEMLLAYRRGAAEFVVRDNTHFHSLIVWFFKNIYQDDRLDDAVLLAEGIFILETCCRGSLKKGYEGLYYDLLNNGCDVEYFFEILLDGVKNHQLSRDVEVACLRQIDPCDHRLKLAVAKEIIKKYGDLLGDEISGHPENYSGRILELLASVLPSIEAFSGIMTRS